MVEETRVLPAEWAPQAGVMLTWPHADSDWGPTLRRVEPVFVEIARQIALRGGGGDRVPRRGAGRPTCASCCAAPGSTTRGAAARGAQRRHLGPRPRAADGDGRRGAAGPRLRVQRLGRQVRGEPRTT